jgi:activator of HSP90 ATPase
MPAKTKSLKTIRQKVFINAPPEKVYNAYLNSKAHSEFTGSKATIVPRVGGRISAWDGYITGKNVKLTKGKIIIQEWKTTEWPKGYSSSKLSLSFKKKGKGTELTMVHSQVPASQSKSYSKGWKDYYWKPLQKYLNKKK